MRLSLSLLALGAASVMAVSASAQTQCLRTDPKTGRSFTVLAEITDGIGGLPKVDEDDAGCVPGAFTRAIAYLNKQNSSEGGGGGGARPNDPNLVAGGTAASGGPYDELKTRLKWGAGGTPGSRNDWLIVKEAYVKGLGLPINTHDISAPPEGESIKGFLDVMVSAINNGGAVEIHLAQGSLWHFSMVSQVIQYSNGNYGIVLSDDKGQGDGKPATETRGPFEFDPATGACVNDSRVKILGMLIERWVK